MIPKLAKVHEIFAKTSSLTKGMSNFDEDVDSGCNLLDMINEGTINRNIQSFAQSILKAKLDVERDIAKELDAKLINNRTGRALNRAFGNDLLNRVCNGIQARQIRTEARSSLLQSMQRTKADSA